MKRILAVFLTTALLCGCTYTRPAPPEPEPPPTHATIAGNEYSIATTRTLIFEWTALTEEDMEQVGLLVNLTQLEIKASGISDISALTKLVKLERLDLRFNNIDNIIPIANLTNLTHLYLQHNELRDISRLSRLVDLKVLEIGANFLSDLSPLSGQLTKLEDLYIYDNARDAKDIPFFDEHTQGAVIRTMFPGVRIHF
jgi:Leucine-rich repeat (LRR) protein